MFTVVQVVPSGRTRCTRAQAFGVSYRVLTVAPNRRGEFPWRQIVRAAGDTPLVLPRAVTPPSGVCAFCGTALRRTWMIAAARRVLHSAPPERRQVAIYDRDAAYPEIPLALAACAGELQIVTDRRGGFETVARTVMMRYGAALQFVTPAVARKASLAVAPCGLWANLPRPAVTFSGADCDLADVFDGYLPPREWAVSHATPRLYDALYQVGRVRALAQISPQAACRAGKTLDIAHAV